MFAEHYLQLGDRRIDFLLLLESGYNIEKYQPGHLKMKGGGEFHDSKQEDFRKLIDYRWSTITDTYTLKQVADCTDQMIYLEQELERGLIDAINYWKNKWHTTAPYIVRRAKGETNRAYSLVHGYRFYDNNNPYRPPFWGEERSKHVQQKLKLTIEHGPWLEHPPGETDAIEMSNYFCHNYIVNPGMESWTAGVLDDWSNYQAPTSVEQESGIVYAGIYSAKITTAVGARRGIIQTIDNLTVGARYVVTARIYADSGTPRLIALPPAAATPIAQSSGQSNPEWALDTLTFNAEDTSARILVGTNNGDQGVFYADDVRWERCTGTIEIVDERFVPLKMNDNCYTTDPATISFLGTLRAGDTGGNDYDLGIRFQNVNIPAGATINSAYIQFTADTTQATAGIALTIQGEDDGTPAKYTTYADFQGRTLTTASVAWAPAAWTTQMQYTTPDISTIVKEIVDRGDWASGNNMAIQIKNNAGAANVFIEASSNDRNFMLPRLIVEFDGGTVEISTTEDPTTDPIYITNQYKTAGITHLFRHRPAFGYSNNLLDLPPTYQLFTSPSTTLDEFVACVSTDLEGGCPFNSIVFDIETPASSSSGHTITWYYNDGVTPWVAFTSANLTDHTDGFENTGINSLHWTPQDDWVATSLNGINGWWMRAVVTYASGTFTPPTIQNKHPYTITVPYVEVPSGQVLGDIPALATALIANKNHNYSGTLAEEYGSNSVFVGLRSLSRGAGFNAYLPFSDDPNYDFLTVTAGTDAVFATDPRAPTGRWLSFTDTTLADAGCTTDKRATMLIPQPYATWYTGKYHAFIRFYSENIEASDDHVYLRLGSNWGAETPCCLITAEDDYVQIADMGAWSLPGWPLYDNLSLGDLEIYLYADGVLNLNVKFLDLILMPIDELAYHAYMPEDGVYLGEYEDIDAYTRLKIDSAGNPKRTKLAIVERVDTEVAFNSWINNASAPLGFQPNQAQRYWFLQRRTYPGSPNTGYPASVGWIDSTAQTWAVDRYSGFRGNR